MASGVPPDGKFGSDCFRFNSKMRQPITILIPPELIRPREIRISVDSIESAR